MIGDAGPNSDWAPARPRHPHGAQLQSLARSGSAFGGGFVQLKRYAKACSAIFMTSFSDPPQPVSCAVNVVSSRADFALTSGSLIGRGVNGHEGFAYSR